MQRQFASLSEHHGTEVTGVRLDAGVRVLVFFPVLLKTESLVAESALEFLDVVHFEMALKRELGLEKLLAVVDLTLKHLRDESFVTRNHTVLPATLYLLSRVYRCRVGPGESHSLLGLRKDFVGIHFIKY